MKYDRSIKALNVHPIVARLIDVRLAWGFTITEIAKRAKCSPMTLGKLERGAGQPSMILLTNWAAALGYELNLWPKGTI